MAEPISPEAVVVPRATDPVRDEAAERRAWSLVWVMTLAMAFYIVDRQMIGLLAPEISRDLKLSDSQLGIVAGLGYSLVYCALSIPWGWVADRPRVSRIGVIAAALAIWSGATAACGAALNFGQLLLARMGVAAGEAGCIPAAQALIAETIPRQKLARAMAIFGLGIPLGALVGKAGGGFLSDHFGWRSAFVMVGAPGVVLAILMVLFFREPRRPQAGPGRKSVVLKALRQIVRSPTLIYICLANIFTGGLSAIIAFWGMVHFQRNLGLSPGEAGLWLGLQSGFTGLVGTLVGGWAADRLAARRASHYMTPAIVGQLIAPALLVVGWATDNWQLALLLTLLPTMCDNLAYGGQAAASQRLLSSDVRSTATALMATGVALLGSGLGVTVFGVASDRIQSLLPASSSPFEGLRYTLMASALLFLLPAFFFWRAGRNIQAELARVDL